MAFVLVLIPPEAPKAELTSSCRCGWYLIVKVALPRSSLRFWSMSSISPSSNWVRSVTDPLPPNVSPPFREFLSAVKMLDGYACTSMKGSTSLPWLLSPSCFSVSTNFLSEHSGMMPAKSPLYLISAPGLAPDTVTIDFEIMLYHLYCSLTICWGFFKLTPYKLGVDPFFIDRPFTSCCIRFGDLSEPRSFEFSRGLIVKLL